MKVSVALHTQLPPLDGNQRTHEATYCGYNRAYVVMEINAEGNGFVKPIIVEFPEVQADPDAPFTHFSFGVCEGIDPGKGGAIINAGPLDEAEVCVVGKQPKILCGGGVFAARFAEMKADGRMGADAAPVAVDDDATPENADQDGQLDGTGEDTDEED